MRFTARAGLLYSPPPPPTTLKHFVFSFVFHILYTHTHVYYMKEIITMDSSIVGNSLETKMEFAIDGEIW